MNNRFIKNKDVEIAFSRVLKSTLHRCQPGLKHVPLGYHTLVSYFKLQYFVRLSLTNRSIGARMQRSSSFNSSSHA